MQSCAACVCVCVFLYLRVYNLAKVDAWKYIFFLQSWKRLSHFITATIKGTILTRGWNSQAYTPGPFPVQGLEVLPHYLGKIYPGCSPLERTMPIPSLSLPHMALTPLCLLPSSWSPCASLRRPVLHLAPGSGQLFYGTFATVRGQHKGLVPAFWLVRILL